MQAPELKKLLPHRQRMLLLREVLCVDESQVAAKALVAPDWPCAWAGFAPPALLLEILAQTVAVYYGAKRRRLGGRALGFLVGVKEAVLNTTALPLGAAITARAVPISLVNNYGVFQGSFGDGDREMGRAVLQVLEQELDEDGFQMPEAARDYAFRDPVGGEFLDRVGGFLRPDGQEGIDGLSAEVWFPETSPWFSGHFPQAPILPGVAMLNLVCHLASQLLGLPGDGALETHFKRVKFTRLNPPGAPLAVSLVVKNASSPHSLQFALTGPEGPVCKGYLCFLPPK